MWRAKFTTSWTKTRSPKTKATSAAVVASRRHVEWPLPSQSRRDDPAHRPGRPCQQGPSTARGAAGACRCAGRSHLRADVSAVSGAGAMTPYYADDLVTIYHGDCREWMPEADV